MALGLARAGWRPPRPRAVPALGRPELATFKAGIHNALRGAQISEHDALVDIRRDSPTFGKQQAFFSTTTTFGICTCRPGSCTGFRR